MNETTFVHNVKTLKDVLGNVKWLRPILCSITTYNYYARLTLICQCLAVNQKYQTILKMIAPLLYNSPRTFIPTLMFETTYLNFHSVLEMFPLNFHRCYVLVMCFVQDILQRSPTMETVQMIQEHLLKYNLNPRMIFSTTLATKNANLILAIWNNLSINVDSVTNEDEVTQLCKLNNPELVHGISQRFHGPNLAQFYSDVVFEAAQLGKFELFQSFYELARIEKNGFDDLFTTAVQGGNTDIVKMCMSTRDNLPTLSSLTMQRAYLSGNTSLIELLKQHQMIKSEHVKEIAEGCYWLFDLYDYEGDIYFNPVLLRELLSTKPASVRTIQNLLISILNIYKNIHFNVDEEIICILAHFFPDIEIVFGTYVDFNTIRTERLIWCLKHFKRIQVPTKVFTAGQLLELMEILDPVQFLAAPEPKSEDINQVVLNLINAKRIVYLFFAQETELRDNAELILEYMTAA